jgi:molecular chaperone GrpE
MTEPHDEHPESGQARRRRTRAEERIAALDAETTKGAAPSPAVESTGATAGVDADLERLRGELEAARQDAADMRAAWQRSAADFANYKRRTEREREETAGLANAALLVRLLDVVDDYDRALASVPKELSHFGWIDGLWLIEAKLRALLDSEGVTPIEALGKPFDPREHEAVIHEETTSAPDGTVIGELQKGYRIRDRVLRPSLVSVANNAGHKAGPGGNH